MANPLDIVSNYDMKDSPDMMLKQQTPIDFDILSANSNTDGDWTSIVILALNSGVSVTTPSGAKSLDACVGKFPSGLQLIGRFSNITIPTGSSTVIIAYKRVA